MFLFDILITFSSQFMLFVSEYALIFLPVYKILGISLKKSNVSLLLDLSMNVIIRIFNRRKLIGYYYEY